MMYVNFEKGWLPKRFREDEEFGDPLSRVEYIAHLLSRVKWKNLALAMIIATGFIVGVMSMGKTIFQSLPAWQEERHQRYIQEEMSKYELVEVYIQKGDTAWSIQQDLTPNAHDLREVFYLADTINGEVDWGNLLPGRTYVFLKEK